jgi:hypothetical protein
MRRALVQVLVLIAALATATPAPAAIFVHLATSSVHRGGSLRLLGDAAHLPLYALPAARMPCARTGTCAEPIHRDSAPKRKPFVFLGYTPGTTAGMAPSRKFSIRLPQALRPGAYKVFVWCAACGGSLIVAGPDASGQTLRVVR